MAKSRADSRLDPLNGRLLDGFTFCKRVYALFDAVRASTGGISRLRRRAGLVEKRLIQELLPLTRYIQLRYDAGRRIRVRWQAGDQPGDASLLSRGPSSVLLVAAPVGQGRRQRTFGGRSRSVDEELGLRRRRGQNYGRPPGRCRLHALEVVALGAEAPGAQARPEELEEPGVEGPAALEVVAPGAEALGVLGAEGLAEPVRLGSHLRPDLASNRRLPRLARNLLRQDRG